VQLATRQNFCIQHLPMLKCYNSTALNWYQTLLDWHHHISARKPRQLWFWWYAVHSDPSSDGSPTWIQATLRSGLHLELAWCIRKIIILIQPFKKGTGPSCWPRSLGTILGGCAPPVPPRPFEPCSKCSAFNCSATFAASFHYSEGSGGSTHDGNQLEMSNCN
jgi:hypothetical protein